MSDIDGAIVTALQAVIDNAQLPFENILKEEDLVEKLNAVDDFIKARAMNDSEGSSVVNNNTSSSAVSPQELLQKRLLSSKLVALEQMRAHLAKVNSENEILSENLKHQTDVFMGKLGQLQSSQQLLDTALNQVSSVSLNELEGLVDRMLSQSSIGGVNEQS